MRNGSLKVQLTTFCVCMLSMLYTYIIFHVIVGYESAYLSIGSNPIVILLMDKMWQQLGNVQSTVLSEICTKNSCPRYWHCLSLQYDWGVTRHFSTDVWAQPVERYCEYILYIHILMRILHIWIVNNINNVQGDSRTSTPRQGRQCTSKRLNSDMNNGMHKCL